MNKQHAQKASKKAHIGQSIGKLGLDLTPRSLIKSRKVCSACSRSLSKGRLEGVACRGAWVASEAARLEACAGCVSPFSR